VPILPDVLDYDLDAVFCGSAAGAESARRGQYYAGPGNRFWPTLAAVGLTSEELPPERFRELPRYGLGLTDLCQNASGADADLPADGDDPAALAAKIRRYRPRVLAFVGKRPAQAFLGVSKVGTGVQASSPFAETVLFVLPSPSGAARGHWDLEPWRALARYLGRTVPSDPPGAER
jgi:TDG/mug DNA glycosylase family protein